MKWIDKYNFKDKAFLFGLLISFIGSLPLGYLNVIGLQILLEKGFLAILFFVIGIITVEFLVLNIVSFAANWLVKQKNLLVFIDVFTILFFVCIAFYFISNISNEKSFSLSQLKLAYYPFVLGVFLNGLNAMQWPYWSGIYIYIFRTKQLKTTKKANYIFIIGALIGTGIGMLFFAYAGQYILVESKIEITKYFNPIFALLFIILATIQIVKLFVQKNKNEKKAGSTRY